jgi:hypothetical protein
MEAATAAPAFLPTSSLTTPVAVEAMAVVAAVATTGAAAAMDSHG